MSITADLYPTMPSRPCSFCLRLQGGSVFADFDSDQTGLVVLRRISFDGYGCCHAESVSPMDANASKSLLDAVAQGKVDTPEATEALRNYFLANKDALWSDALLDHELL